MSLAVVATGLSSNPVLTLSPTLQVLHTSPVGTDFVDLVYIAFRTPTKPQVIIEVKDNTTQGIVTTQLLTIDSDLPIALPPNRKLSVRTVSSSIAIAQYITAHVIRDTDVSGCLAASITVNGDVYSSVSSGGSDDIPVVNSVPAPVGTVNAGGNIDVADSEITINGGAFTSTPAEVDIDIDVQYENGTPVGVDVAGIWTIPNPGICDDATITVNSQAYSSVASGGSDDIPVVNSAATPIGTVTPGGDVTIPDLDITVNGSAYGSTPATVDFDVDVVDSSRAPTGSLNVFGEWEVPAGAAPVGAKILKTGQTVSYRTGDDGDLQSGRDSTFLVLPENNPFGNTNRFTDTLGGLTFANDWVIDWSTFNNTTVLGYYRVLSADADWNTSIDECLANTFGTFSGCRLPNIAELMNLNNYASTNHIWNYAPFSFVYTGYFWSSTSNGTRAIAAYPFLGLSAASVIGAVGSRRYIPVRTFTVTGTTLS